MVYPRYVYEFQFNNDEASCVVFLALIKEGWTISGYKTEDGYTWFILQYEK